MHSRKKESRLLNRGVREKTKGEIIGLVVQSNQVIRAKPQAKRRRKRARSKYEP